MEKKFDAIIFDLDGTIADSFEVALEIFKENAEKLGIKDIENKDLDKIRNSHWKDVVDELEIGVAKIPFILKFMLNKVEERADEIEPFEGVLEIIKELKKSGCTLGILSSNNIATINIFLKNNGIEDCFEFINSEKNLFGKHKSLNKIIKNRKLDKEKVLYIGDEIRDIEAAHKAGIKIAVVSWGYNAADALKEHSPDYFAEKPEDLLSYASA